MRGRGRKRIGMIDELMENKQYGDLKRRAEDRQGWRVGYQGPAVWQNTEEDLSSLRFASGCLCSASFTPLYFWRMQTAPNRKLVSARDCHTFAALDRPISAVPSLASPPYHPFWHSTTLHCS